MSRPMTELEERHISRLAGILEDAENALYCPSPHEAQRPLADRNKAVSSAQQALTDYLNHITGPVPSMTLSHLIRNMKGER
jgi:hypothetical protein